MKDQDRRYRVVFTPIGWMIIDTHKGGEVGPAFGTNAAEYHRCKTECDRMNEEYLVERDAMRAASAGAWEEA